MFEQLAKLLGIESKKHFAFQCEDGDVVIVVAQTSAETYETLMVCTVELEPYIVRRETNSDMQGAMRVVIDMLKAEYDIREEG